ncbi:hypothetical protein C8R45DRAFT_960444 [Mycena sanguinolenta]|nr:hypothetical protein C8R45DRAFT_960444 [Mycena sanguinolenta]
MARLSSLDPSGAGRVTPEDAAGLVFPSLDLSTEIRGWSWDATVYAGLRQFHQVKGFAPDSQDAAQHLGHQLYQVSGPFAHIDDQYSENISEGDNTSEGEDTSDGQDIARDLAEELVDSTLTHSGIERNASSIDQVREEIPLSSTFKFVSSVQLSLIFFVVWLSAWSEM